MIALVPTTFADKVVCVSLMIPGASENTNIILIFMNDPESVLDSVNGRSLVFSIKKSAGSTTVSFSFGPFLPPQSSLGHMRRHKDKSSQMNELTRSEKGRRKWNRNTHTRTHSEEEEGKVVTKVVILMSYFRCS